MSPILHGICILVVCVVYSCLRFIGVQVISQDTTKPQYQYEETLFFLNIVLACN